jgi:iron complex outermembrane receptor protein
MSKQKKYIAGCVAMAILSMSHTQAQAQDVTDEEQDAKLEIINITAQRRTQNLQEVPIAVTALSAEKIERSGIHDLTDVATRVPGLTFSPFSPGQNILALRGASSNDDGAGTDSSVAVFIDDVYLGRVSNVNPELFDLESIEVLRGPQGTLFGKNTIGGAINITSSKPNTDEFEGKVKATLGNFGLKELGGLVTGPLSDDWAGKISFNSRTRDGWVDNVFLNKKQKDDDAQVVRGQLQYSGDTFTGLFSADYNQLDVQDSARIPIDTGEPGDPAFWATNVPGSYAELCAGRGPECSAGPVDGFVKKAAWGVSSKLVWDFKSGELTSITAYRESENDWNMDSTGTPASPLPSSVFGLVNDDIFDVTEQFTQEFRWVSSIGDSIEYVSGLWYSKEDTDRTECFDNDPTPSDCTPDADGGLTDWYRQVNEATSYAAFGQFDWELDEQWTLTLGGRYSYEEKEIDNEAVAGDFVIINQTFSNTVKDDWNALTLKGSIAYQVSNQTNVYFTYAEGFKSGGFAAAPQGIEFTQPLDQEESTNFEFGFKSDLSDLFRLNAALFYTEYEGLQIQTFGPLTTGASFGTFQTFNAGDANIAGIELEATWIISDNLTLSGFYAYQDSEFEETNIPGTAFPNQEGQDLIRTPEVKYNIDLNYYIPLDSGAEINTSLNYRFTDDQRGELEPWAIQPKFNLLDARITWTNSDETLDMSLWGRNLTDTEYVAHLYTIASSVVAVFGDPRTFGLSVTYRFD